MAALAILGTLAGLGGALTYLMQGYAQFRIFQEGRNLFSSAKNFMGAHFHEYAENNPFINFFFVSGIVVFLSSFLITFAYKTFGLQMNKKVKTYILLSPFFVLFCGIIYVGYVHNLRTKDTVYTIFANARTEGEVASKKTKYNFSHHDEMKYKKNYVFECIGKSTLSQSFYSDMCRDLSYSELNRCALKNIKVVSFYNRAREYRLHITPLMYAAYIGNKAAVAALLESGKADLKAVVKTVENPTCPNFWGAWGYTYKYTTTHTPYSIARDNRHGVKNMIEKASKAIGYYDYKGYNSSTHKGSC